MRMRVFLFLLLTFPIAVASHADLIVKCYSCNRPPGGGPCSFNGRVGTWGPSEGIYNVCVIPGIANVEEISPDDAFFTDAQVRAHSLALKRGRWSVRPGVGFAFSTLYDERYTSRTVFVSQPREGFPSTRTELIRENHDAVSLDPVVTLSLSKPESRNALTLGVGLTRGGAGRGHLAYGFKLGGVALLSLGIAAGPVERLSGAVNRMDAGNIDPALATRSVIRVAPFAGVSFQFGNE